MINFIKPSKFFYSVFLQRKNNWENEEIFSKFISIAPNQS